MIESLWDKLKNLIGWKKGEKERRERAKKSIVIFLSLFGVLLVSVVLHNLLAEIFGVEEIVFFVVSMSLILFLPFYLVYSTVAVLDYLIKKYVKFK